MTKASDALRWADLETVADALGDLDVTELKLRLARLGVNLGLQDPGAFTSTAARVFEASGIADAAPGTGPASSSETELSTRGHYREELLRVVRGCNKAERLINKAEIGAKAAEALAQLRSSATTVRKLLSQPGSPAAPGRGHRPCAPRPASASPGRAGRFDLPPDVPGASRPASPSPARGGAAPEPWIPPGYDGLDAAAARERQATASERSIVRVLQEEIKTLRRERAEEVGALRREAAAVRAKCAKLERQAELLRAREGARGAEKSALKAALDAREHRARQAEMRSRETEEMTLRARQRYADELAKTRLERDELKAILLSTLKRLEQVEEVISRQDASHAVMVEKLRAMEQEKERALNAAAALSEEARATSLEKDALRREVDMLQTLARAGKLSAAGRDRALQEYFQGQPGMRDKVQRVLQTLGGAAADTDSEALSPATTDSLEEGAVRDVPPSLRMSQLARELGMATRA